MDISPFRERLLAIPQLTASTKKNIYTATTSKISRVKRKCSKKLGNLHPTTECMISSAKPAVRRRKMRKKKKCHSVFTVSRKRRECRMEFRRRFPQTLFTTPSRGYFYTESFPILQNVTLWFSSYAPRSHSPARSSQTPISCCLISSPFP